MDADMLEKDLVQAFREVPKKFVEDVAQVLMAHDLREVWPRVSPFLMRNIRTIAMEAFTGMLDSDGIEKALRGAAAQVGVKLPDPK